jgi:gliding motility-associated-like protein
VVRPIYVSEKPKPVMNVSPGTYICPNTTVTVTNRTVGNAVEGGECSTGIPVWTIIPSKGWKLTKGTLGNDDGSNIVSRWIPGSDQLQITFTDTGRYKILMRIGTTLCGIAQQVTDVYVNPLPTGSFTTDVSEGCGPFVVKTTTKSNIPLYGKNEYNWTVSYSPLGNCGNYNSLYEYSNGTDSSSENPEFKFINPGVYKLGLMVTNSNGQCTSAKVFNSITVKGKPAAEINGLSSVICGNGSVSPTVDVKCFEDSNTGFRWLFKGAFPDSSDSRSPGEIVYKEPGLYSIALKVNNSCGDSTFVVPLLVNPVPVIGAVNKKDPDRCDQPNGTIQLTELDKNSPFTYYYTFNGKSDSLVVESDGNGVVTISGLDAGTYSHIALKAGGCISQEVGPITLNNAVVASPDFDLDQTNACGPVTVHFTNNTANLSAFKYNWNFGTGKDSSVLPNPGDVTFYPGANGQDTVYIIKLSAGLPTCEFKTIEKTITVKSRPIPFFSPDKSVGCSPMKVTFTNVSRGLTTKYYWDFGDGTKLETDKADQQEHTFTTVNGKVYPVKLIAENGCGKDTFNLDIKVAPNSINLNLTMNGPDHAGCVPHTVTLYNNSSGGTAFEWDFGDGTIQSTSDNRDSVKHTYIKEGNYTIRLNASNSCSEKSTSDYVVVNASPTASFIADRYKLCANQEIQFTNQSQSATSYKWDFGDGSPTSDKMDPKHAYATPGFYRVVLTANRVNGPNNVCSRIMEKIIEVSAPVISIVGDAVNCTNVPLLFASNIQSNEKVTRTTWELSNGVTSFDENFKYSFLSAGNYSLKLTATSEIGCSTSIDKQIKIDPSPVLVMSNSTVICQGKSTTLSVSGASSYEWLPTTNLSCSTCESPVASPITSTAYLVKGVNSFKCTTTGTVQITVIEPITLLTSPNDSICQGQTAHLRVSGADKYIWTPSESLNDNLIANPIANPKLTTVYKVTGYDNYSCFSNTTEVKISVGEIPTIDLGPDKIVAAGTILPLTFKTNGVPIKSYLWSPPELLDCADCSNPNATIKRDISYSVLAKTAYGCEATDIINITSICENTQVFIPNSFTPDGDGLNDILMVRGKGIARVKSFRIFNRLGEVVFERSDFPPNEPTYGWDGRLRGVLSPSAVYVYTAEVVCDNGLSFIYKGNITVLK